MELKFEAEAPHSAEKPLVEVLIEKTPPQEGLELKQLPQPSAESKAEDRPSSWSLVRKALHPANVIRRTSVWSEEKLEPVRGVYEWSLNSLAVLRIVNLALWVQSDRDVVCSGGWRV